MGTLVMPLIFMALGLHAIQGGLESGLRATSGMLHWFLRSTFSGMRWIGKGICTSGSPVGKKKLSGLHILHSGLWSGSKATCCCERADTLDICR